VRQERILIKETPDQVIPVLSKALTDDMVQGGVK